MVFIVSQNTTIVRHVFLNRRMALLAGLSTPLSNLSGPLFVIPDSAKGWEALI
jgi:hypothetical protein